MRFRQEVRNAQQNLIRQIGFWRRTGGEHPTSVNNALESLMTRQGAPVEILKHRMPTHRSHPQVQAVCNLVLPQGIEKRLTTESAPLISSLISYLLFCILYIEALIS